MIKLLKYMRDYVKECILGPLFKLMEAGFDLAVPLVVRAVIDNGVAKGDNGYVLRMTLLLIGLGLTGLCCAITAQYFAARAATGFSSRIRSALFHHIEKLSYQELDTLGTSTLITRMTGDINQVQSGVNLLLRLFLRSPFIVFGAMIMAFTIDVPSAVTFAVVIPLLCAVVFGIMLISIPLYKKVQKKTDALTTVTRENLYGVRVIRAFCQEDEETERFAASNNALAEIQRFVGRISALLNPLTCIMINVAVIVLLTVSGKRVDTGVLTQGDVVALYNYMSQILVELIKLANLIITVTKAFACASRIEAVFAVQPDITYPEAKPEPTDEHGVVFRHVSFTYRGAGAPSLNDVSFSAPSGSTVGIIGGTGSGKSTLVNLIPRFYDATGGEIRIDGIPVKDYPEKELRRAVGIVPQKAQLFRGTIAENLRWGNPDATDEELLTAVRTAQAEDIIKAKSGGLQEEIVQGGGNLSGGQKQRLTIARALVARPRILILDDSASALDYATDAALRRSLAEMDGSPTVFLVSQRASSVMHADMILVLDDGAVVGMGTHRELLASCPCYREIYESQFSAEGKEA